MLLVGLVGVYFFLPQLVSLKQTFSVLAHTSWWWVAIGLFVSAIGVVVTVVMQYISGRGASTIFGVGVLQFARQFVNSFLPYSLGSVGLAVTYYQRFGKQRSTAFAIAVLPTIVVSVTTFLLLVVMAPISFTHLIQNIHVRMDDLWQTLAIILLAFGITVAILAFRRKANEFMGRAVSTLLSAQGMSLIAGLGCGAIVVNILSATTLFIAALAAHAPLTFVNAFALYVTAWVVSNITPTPGGIGPTEAVLVLGLTAGGMTLPQAAATTVIFRFLTFWALILPGGVAFHVLRQSVAKKPIGIRLDAKPDVSL